MTAQQSIEIYAAAEVVFNYLLDVENRTGYVPDLEEVVLLDPLPIRPGSRYTEVGKIAGRRMETTYEVTVLQPNRQLSARTLQSVFPIQADLLLVENPGSCTLEIRLDFQLNGAFRLASGIIRGIVNQQAKDILRKVKMNLEGE